MQQSMRVLIVEDLVTEAELAVRQLTAAGIDCDYQLVDDELSFRGALSGFRPHVILSDFTLPSFNGLAALEIARQECPDVPFVFVSGTIGEEGAIDALRRGAVDYVLKTNLARLPQVVQRAMREVAERRRRHLAEKRIHENEQRLRDIVNTAQDWIWEMDALGRFVFCSESVRQILGRESNTLIGTHFSKLLHEEDAAEFAATLGALGPEHRTSRGILSRWRHGDGQHRWLEGNLLGLIGPGGRLTGYRGTHRDVTERKQQQEHIARLTRMLQMQSGINGAVVRVRDRDELLQEACRIATQVGGYDRAVVTLVDPGGKVARPLFRSDAGDDFPVPPVLELSDGTEPDTSLVSRALRTGEVQICSDLTQSEPPVAQREKLLKRGFRTLVALPFIVDGTPVGAMVLASREANLLADEELRLLQDIRANLSFALRSRRNEDAVQFLAYFDPLTGLAKRPLFCERLDRLMRQRIDPAETIVVIVFDIQHLNRVNDSFGRHVGDQLLQQVAERLRQLSDGDERIGHLGGGTFALVVPLHGAAEDTTTTLIGNTVLKEPFTIDGRTIRVSFKSGIARYPGDGDDGSTLVQRAEAALKRAKECDEQAMHYQVRVHSEIAERLALEHRLRIALDEEQFVLHYQPQLSTESGRVECVEALLRWNDPEQGLVPPAHFLPVLESSGMIVPVGNWVLRQAARDCNRLRQLNLGPVRIAVNVSALQMRPRAFVQQTLMALDEIPRDGYGIDLEITETSLLQDAEGTSRKLHELREAGVRVAIDDFGTGYSSLGLLSRLPVDLLKIDRGFVSGLPLSAASITLVSSIIGLAFAFNLIAVAEGVETPEQLNLLRTLKCHLWQGYLHSPPVPMQELETLLARGGIPTA